MGVTRPLSYLLALAVTTDRLRSLHALRAAGLPVPPGLVARCWADATGGNVAQAREYLRGARPWPSPGRKRGALIRAVEAWEASVAKMQAENAGRNALSVDIDCTDPLPGSW